MLFTTNQTNGVRIQTYEDRAASVLLPGCRNVHQNSAQVKSGGNDRRDTRPRINIYDYPPRRIINTPGVPEKARTCSFTSLKQQHINICYPVLPRSSGRSNLTDNDAEIPSYCAAKDAMKRSRFCVSRYVIVLTAEITRFLL